jgi:hypothetical protein
MQIINTPEPFSPAFGEILYAVALTEEERGAEIAIFNSAGQAMIGIKKATEVPEFSLNVADFLRSQVTIEPLPRQVCQIIEAPDRLFRSLIAHGDWTASQLHTAGIVPVGMNEAMCDPGLRSLGPDEQDEIGWVAGAGTHFARALFPITGKDPLEIQLGRIEIAEPRMLALIVNSDDLDLGLQQRGWGWDDFDRFTVEIHFNYQKITAFEYVVRPSNRSKTRLAWWNRQGAIDFHSFESTSREERLFEKREADTGNRKMPVSAQCQLIRTLHTAHTTREQALRLSQIVGSPQVWIAEGDTFIPVEIRSEKPFPIAENGETAIELQVVGTEPLLFQSF